MMNKTRSARVHLLRFLFVLPIVAVILISFRDQIGETFAPVQPQVLTDTIPDTKTPNDKGYIINIKDNKGQCMVVVKDIKGAVVEKLPLTSWQEKENLYTEKYGEIPPPPPPKPPVPALDVYPVSPATPVSPGTPVNPPNPANPAKPGEPAQPPAPPAPVRVSDKLLTMSDDFEINNYSATIRLKDGTVEKYDLTVTADKKKFENKWGKIIETSDVAPVAIVHHEDGQTVIASVAPAAIGSDVLAIDDHGAVITGKEDVLLTITKYTSRKQLDELRKQMQGKNIELTFDDIEYNEKGFLVVLTGKLRSGGSQSNFSAIDFEKLVLAMITNNGRTYFKVNTSNTKEVVKENPNQNKSGSKNVDRQAPRPVGSTPLFPVNPFAPVKKDGC